jgi:hypothetical protein
VPDAIVGRLKVRLVVVCEHGVFFRFSMGERGDRGLWWLGFTPPTSAHYRYCLEGELEGKALQVALAAAVAEGKTQYQELRQELPVFLGRRYREGKRLPFRRAYQRELIIDGMMWIEWRGRGLAIELMPTLYQR